MFGPSAVGTLLDSIGLSGCAPESGEHVLRITLVSASNVGLRSAFYFEAWGEGGQGYPKNSRVHRPSTSLDLGCEKMELEWSGREREVVIQAVNYTGKTMHRDTSIAEVRIPRDAIFRYAREALQDRNDFQCGTRVFDMVKLSNEQAFQRKLRFQDMLMPPKWLTAIITKIGAENGVHIPNPEEAARLKAENQRLKDQNGKLRFITGLSEDPQSEEAGKRPLSVTVRFEIMHKKSSGKGSFMIRQASFQNLE